MGNSNQQESTVFLLKLLKELQFLLDGVIVLLYLIKKDSNQLRKLVKL